METVVGLPERPEPPSNLTEDEAVIWREVVATKPADWFMRDTQPLLAAYCQAVVMHKALVAKWHLMPIDAELKDLKSLVEMVSKAANLSSALATKLRLTQQSRYTPLSANTASKKAGPIRPWETAKTG